MFTDFAAVDPRVSPTKQPVAAAVLTRLRRMLGWNTENYDPNQPRDPEGKWTSVGGENFHSEQTTPEPENDTQARYTRDGKYIPERVQSVHEPVLRKMAEGVPQAEGSPTLYMTGGGMGSGKSVILDRYSDVVGFPEHGGAVRSDPDAIKKSIPEYNDLVSRGDKNAAGLVHEESADISKEGVVRGLRGGKNVVYDTSGDSNPDKLHDKVTGFRKKGAARVEANYAFPGSVEEAQRRADARGLKTGRFVPPTLMRANHAEVSRCWVAAARRGTFDSLKLWSTAGPHDQPPTLIASAQKGNIITYDREMFARFKALGETP